MPPAMENILIQWILTEDRTGRAPNYARLRVIGAEILDTADLDIYLS